MLGLQIEPGSCTLFCGWSFRPRFSAAASEDRPRVTRGMDKNVTQKCHHTGKSTPKHIISHQHIACQYNFGVKIKDEGLQQNVINIRNSSISLGCKHKRSTNEGFVVSSYNFKGDNPKS